MPKQCEIIERQGRQMAMWIDRRGAKQYDEVTIGERGQFKIVRQSPTFVARYRDADGLEIIRSTGCRDEQSAKQVLADLVRRVEHVRAGILTNDESRQADHASTRMDEHVAAYLSHLQAKTTRGKKISTHHRVNVEHQVTRVVRECGFRRLGDISRESLEKWMNAREAEGMGGRTRNCHRGSIVAFCNWCVESGRLGFNPLINLSKADEISDRRRVRTPDPGSTS
ncbi:MAG: hypothetical protein K8S99_14470 [Planctomycetes bacterium]|nr:hypothetical protein [Planctomycetota bacterium]